MKKFKLLILKVRCFLSAFVMLLPFPSMASDNRDAGIIASDVFSGIITVKEIVINVYIIIGAFLILSSFFQYKKYRRNPSEMPIGRPITTMIVGIIIIAVTFIPIQLDILNK